MKKLLFLIFLLQSFLFGTVTEPLAFEIGSGYREDHLKWLISSDTPDSQLNYKERYKHPRYLQTNASLRVIDRDIYFFGNFAYSFFASSQMHQKDRDIILYSFDFKNHGYDLESALELGYAVNLTPDHMEKTILIPLFGYSGFWKILKREDSTPTYEQNGAAVSSVLDKRLKQVWFGPYLGVNLEFIPCDRVIFDLGYHFNWLKLKHKSTSDLQIGLIDNYKIIDAALDAHSHAAFGKITYVFTEKFKLAFMGKYDYFISEDKTKVNFVTKAQNIDSDVYKNNFFSRWWYVFLGLEFIFQY